METCPSRAELASTILGEGTEEQAEAILTHLDHCTPCQEIALQLYASAPPPPLTPIADYRDEAQRNPQLIGSSFDRFRILRLHKTGGLGQVSVAFDTDLNREVALKEIQPQYADIHESRRRFAFEAEVTGRLEHPGIVPVYAFGHRHDGRPFYAMRFVGGDTLKDSIERFHHSSHSKDSDPRSRELALRELLKRIVDVCNAVEYAHKKGVLHRDLKPGNIMVGELGETLVVDWGMAKIFGSEEILVTDSSSAQTANPLHSLPGSRIGTPAYMSPEQANGDHENVGPRSDVYSLGATLYSVLTGRPPFQSDDEAVDKLEEIRQKVRAGKFERPRAIVSATPKALEAICLKAMSCSRDDRYATPKQFAEDIDRFLADEPVSVFKDGMLVRIRRWIRNHRTVSTGVATGIAVTLLAGSAWLRAHQDATRMQRAHEARMDRDFVESSKLLERAKEGDPFNPSTWREARELSELALSEIQPTDSVFIRKGLSRVARLADTGEKTSKFLSRLTLVRALAFRDFTGAATDERYQTLFASLGIDLNHLPARKNIEVLSDWSRPALVELTAAIDDWANSRRFAEPNKDSWRSLVEFAKAIDPDENSFRNRIRDLALNKIDADSMLLALCELAKSPQLLDQPSHDIVIVAKTLGKAGGLEEEETLLRRARLKNTNDPWINYQLAVCLRQIGGSLRIEEAIRFYSLARAIRPEIAFELGDILVLTGRLDEARSVFEELLQHFPNDGSINCALAEVMTMQGQSDQAQKVLQRAFKSQEEYSRLHPTESNAINSLGVILTQLNRSKDAIEQFRIAIRLKPDSAQAHSNLGIVLCESRSNQTQAEAECRRAVNLNSSDPGFRNNLGNTLVALGRNEEAVIEYQEALRLQPINPATFHNLGRVLLNLDRTHEAAEMSEKAIQLTPYDGKLYVGRGNVFKRLNNLPDAEKAYREAIRLNPHLIEGWNNLSVILVDIGLLKRNEGATAKNQELVKKGDDALAEAIACATKSVRLDPTIAEAHSNLGRAFLESRNYDQALSAFDEAIRLRPDFVDAHFNRGLVLFSMGEFVRAGLSFQDVTRYQENHPLAICLFGLSIQEQGQYAEGLVELKRGHEIATQQGLSVQQRTGDWLKAGQRKAILEDRLAAMRQRHEKSIDPAERLEFAEIAVRKRLYVFAMELYEEEIADRRLDATDQSSIFRYNSSSCAILAGLGQGTDAPDESEWIQMRTKALKWFSDELDAWEAQMRSDPEKSGENFALVLGTWKSDPDLSLVRDDPVSSALTPGEAEKWGAFWARVNHLHETQVKPVER